jgi:hypothetical protein
VSESVGKTDREEGMKESNSEGVANHADPESCVGFPRGGGEALTGARAGWDIELRKRIPGRGRRGRKRKPVDVRSTERLRASRNTRQRVNSRVLHRPGGVEDPKHVRNLSGREPRDPVVARVMGASRGPEAKQKQRPKATHRKSDRVIVPRKRANNTQGGSRSPWRERP